MWEDEIQDDYGTRKLGRASPSSILQDSESRVV